ncbi:23702_t:CDS:1, partial [Entrophospora sp. SA101]
PESTLPAWQVHTSYNNILLKYSNFDKSSIPQYQLVVRWPPHLALSLALT